MKTQQIEVHIDPDGQVTIHVLGVDGMQCISLTSELEKALGGKVLERRMTSEAYPARQLSNRLTSQNSGVKE